MVSLPALVSYFAAGAAFLLLAFLSSAGWRGARQGALFGLAVWVTTLWALVLVGMSAGFLALSPGVPLFEWARLSMWALFLLTLLAPVFRARAATRRFYPRGPYLLFGASVALAFVVALPGWWLVMDADAETVKALRFGSLLVLAIAGMVLVELLYRSTEQEARWRIKFLCFGLGGLFAYDFILYADALLYQSLDAALWTARGGVNLVIVPMLAVAAARNRTWAIDIQVSRQVVFQSVTVFLSGAYLLLVAGAGYYIRYYGGSWGGIAQAIFLFIAGLVLVLVLASGRLRSQLRVYVSKNFFSYQFDYREQWLRFTDALSRRDTAQAIELRAVEAVGELVESSRGVLWLASGGRYTVAAARNMTDVRHGFESGESLVRFLQGSGWVVDLNEFRDSPRRYGGLELPPWLLAYPDAWLIVPLFLEDELLGFVLLGKPLGTVKVNWEVNDLLKVAGRQAASFIAQDRAARELVVAKQFESFNKMSAFVVHDLKNLVSQLGLILSNAPRLIQNQEFQQDMLDTISNSVHRINRMLGQLHDASVPADRPALVDVADVAQRALQSLPGAQAAVRCVDARGDGARGARVLANPERLERVVRHLVTNAIQATEQRPVAERNVNLRIDETQDGGIAIEVNDNGVGMAPEFLTTRLFRPFESTKAAGTGLGVYESREYVRAIGGDIMVNSELGVGTSMRITLPVVDTQVERSTA